MIAGGQFNRQFLQIWHFWAECVTIGQKKEDVYEKIQMPAGGGGFFGVSVISGGACVGVIGPPDGRVGRYGGFIVEEAGESGLL